MGGYASIWNTQYWTEQQLKSTTTKKPKYRIPESWATGLILTNWELVIQLWENPIESSQKAPTGVEPINNHYFILQKARKALLSNNIINQQDKTLIIKSECDLAKLSTNQLKLWLVNFQTLNNLNCTEHTTGTAEPPRNSDNANFKTSNILNFIEIEPGPSEPSPNPDNTKHQLSNTLNLTENKMGPSEPPPNSTSNNKNIK